VIKQELTTHLSRAVMFQCQMAGQWINALHTGIPRIESPARERFDKIWGNVTNPIRKSLVQFFPGLKKQKGYLDRQLASLNPIREEIKDKIGGFLVNMSAESPTVCAKLQAELQAKWHSHFKKAENVRPGRGIMKRRHELLIAHAKSPAAQKGFKEAVKTMEDGFIEVRSKLIEELDRGWEDCVSKFHHQLRLIIGNILQAAEVEHNQTWSERYSESEESRDSRLILQKGVRNMLVDWASAWNATEIDVSDAAADTSFPTKFTLELSGATKGDGKAADTDVKMEDASSSASCTSDSSDSSDSADSANSSDDEDDEDVPKTIIKKEKD
jgi:hypothetical protein